MSSLYEQDFSQWAETMAELLENGQFSALDIENLVEEVRDLSKRERDRLLSSIRLILHHLLKWDHQPQKRSRSWQVTIERERNNIQQYLEDSPSLKRFLTQQWIDKAYVNARLNAIAETGIDMPKDCSYRLADVLDRSLNF
ncbi:DUF29 domain-containing protein [Picosynechococcus sp. PCC 11901]|uniref:DUF29 domain-containing protein n=1 Tax=Picosynechococcus sp. PCC 11901 TaxID=2579791 RepID=UPI0010FC2DFA|nr:DUF29 domain-containing protein [Picosynechococcus sp. PCC 11901]QCS49046.1 DUF29 domain-containing protein [Picosynechococcus sp. PCC 11901]